MSGLSRRTLLSAAGVIGCGMALPSPAFSAGAARAARAARTTAHSGTAEAAGTDLDTGPARQPCNDCCPSTPTSSGSPRHPGHRPGPLPDRRLDRPYRGRRHRPGGRPDRGELVSQVRLSGAHLLEQLPTRPSTPAARTAPAGPAGGDRPAPVRLQRHQRGVHGPYLTGPTGSGDRRARPARLQRSAHYTGQEAVYQQRASSEFGYSAPRHAAGCPEPGPPAVVAAAEHVLHGGSPISQQLIDRRAALARRIIDRLRELGMAPGAARLLRDGPDRLRDAESRGATPSRRAPGTACERPDWLDPTGRSSAGSRRRSTGTRPSCSVPPRCTRWTCCTRVAPPGAVPVGPASKAVQDALRDRTPGRDLGDPRLARPTRCRRPLQAVDRARMFVVDGPQRAAHRHRPRARTSSAPRTPSARSGTSAAHQEVGAASTVWNEKFNAWRAKPGNAHDRHRADCPKPSSGTTRPRRRSSPRLAVEDGPVDRDAWFAEYASARYGAADPAALAACADHRAARRTHWPASEGRPAT